MEILHSVSMQDKKTLPLKIVICLLLASSTLLLYFQTRTFDFVGLDDPDYVTKNPIVKAGLSSQGIRWSFEHSFSSNWHPLTWISHMTDCEVFGVDAGKHHLVNVAFHIANTCLLFLWLTYLTNFLWRSAVVAALFGLHPLHVESVAWISERKDVLSAFFFILTLWAYCGYAKPTLAGSNKTDNQKGQRRFFLYFLALILFALGLMSKPMLVTLPMILLLLDFWPLRRIPISGISKATAIRLLTEKIPFLMLAVTSCAITLWTQGKGHSIGSLDQFPLWNRIINSLASYLTYFLKTLYPIDLAAFYPFPLNLDYLRAMLAVLFFCALLIWGWRRRKSNPYIMVGCLWYLSMLLPVIGLVQVGGQAMADRYTYLPLIGLFLLMTWLVGDVLSSAANGKIYKIIIVTATMILCSIFTSKQVGTWRNTRTLFEHAALVTKSNYLAWTAIGNILNGEGKQDEAYECFSKAVEMRRNFPNSWFGLAVVLYGQGKTDEAFTCYKEAIRLNADDPEMIDGYGVALFQSGQLQEAEGCFKKAIDIRPIYAEAHLHLAMLLQKTGRLEEALPHYLESVRLEPAAPDGHFNLGNAYLVEKKLDEAMREYALAIQLRPRFNEARIALANIFSQRGLFEAAATNYSDVLKVSPTNSFALDGLGYAKAMTGQSDEAYPLFLKSIQQATNNPNAHLHLAMALEKRNEINQAISHYQWAVELDTNLVAALNNLSWLRATHPDPDLRNGAQAVKLAEHACEITTFSEPMLLGTLAAAYAEAGQFPDAIRTAEKARTIALNNGQKEVADKNAELLELYRAGKAYHEPGK